jgi:hypothetical protein
LSIADILADSSASTSAILAETSEEKAALEKA